MRFLGIQRSDSLVSSEEATPSDTPDETINEIVEVIRDIQKLNAHFECELGRLKRKKQRERRDRGGWLGWMEMMHIPRFIVRFLFPICAAWQSLVLLIITLVETSVFHEDHANKNSDDTVTKVLMMLFQGLNLIFIVITSVKLYKQFMHHTATGLFLLQSYMATTLLFAGVYTTLEMMTAPAKDDIRAFTGFHGIDSYSNSSELWTADVFLQLTFYSISSATLCGSSGVHPVQWYSYLVSSIEILMSFLYFSAIMGQFLHNRQEDMLSYDPISNFQVAETIKHEIRKHSQSSKDINRNPVGLNNEILSESQTEEANDVLTSLDLSNKRTNSRQTATHAPRNSVSNSTSQNSNSRQKPTRVGNFRRHSENALLSINGGDWSGQFLTGNSINQSAHLDDKLRAIRIQVSTLIGMLKED